MKIRALFVLVLLATLSTACRQPDGVTPTLDAQNANRIVDLSRDLGAIASGDAGAQKDFVDDLVVFVDSHATEAQGVVQGFAGRLAAAVSSATMTDPAAEQLARTSWMVVGITDLSDRQLRTLQGDLRSQLMVLGIPQDRVDAVVAEVPTVQRAVTTRPRRWYEVL